MPGVQKVAWVEKLNILIGAVYSGNLREREQERMNTTKFVLCQFPDRMEFRWRNANFETVELDMFSQDLGQWVCVLMK